jgi:MFS family permease
LTVAALSLPLFVALDRIRAADIHFGRACGAPHHHTSGQPARVSRRNLWKSPGLLTFATCVFLFELANASMLPTVIEALVHQGERRSSLIVSALVVLPQVIVALMAPWVGRQAKSRGRRPLLLIGFGALLIHALLFASVVNPTLIVGFQFLDGISAVVLGVLTPLVIADVTSGTGRFNLAQGIVGTASGIGASLSTTVFGLAAVSFGRTAVFLSIAFVGLVAVLILWFFMPEAKRKRWREEGTKKGQEFLGKHMIPVILGPKGRHYVIDHHHLARALHDEGVKNVAVTIIANLSTLDRDAFWFVMDNCDWALLLMRKVLAGLLVTCRSR